MGVSFFDFTKPFVLNFTASFTCKYSDEVCNQSLCLAYLKEVALYRVLAAPGKDLEQICKLYMTACEIEDVIRPLDQKSADLCDVVKAKLFKRFILLDELSLCW